MSIVYDSNLIGIENDIGIRYNKVNGDIYDGLIKSGAVLILDANRPSGKPFTKLLPRTLPNGVSNGEYTPQRVSGDVVITDSMISNFATFPSNTNLVDIKLPLNSVDITDTSVGVALVDGIAETPSANFNNVNFVYRFYPSISNTGVLRVILPKTVLNLTQAREFINGRTTRYQLATPIDTLNSPFVNPLVDLANKVGKNLCDPMNIEHGGVSDTGVLSSEATRVRTPLIKESSGTQLTVKVNNPSFRIRNVIAFNNGVFHSTIYGGSVYTERTFVMPVGANEYRIAFCKTNTTDVITPTEFQQSQTQLELGAVATPYEPYKLNNALLQNFIPSSADGYATIIAPNENGANSVDVNQVVVNGDFAAGTAGWVAGGGTSAVLNKICSTTGNGTTNVVVNTQTTNIKLNLADKIFPKTRFRVTNSNCQFLRIRVATVGGTAIADTSITNPVANQWYDLQSIISVNAGNENKAISVSCQSVYADSATANGKVMEVDGNTGVFAIPMSGTPYENFTAEQMNQLVSKGYFEGNKTIRYSTPTVLNLDGSNSFGALASSDDLSPVGSDDFAQLVVFKPDGTISGVFGICRNNDDFGSSLQYRLALSTTYTYHIGGVFNAVGSVPMQLQYCIYGRINGQSFINVNGVELKSDANSVSLVSQPNTQLCCRSNSTNGLTKTQFAKGYQGICAFWKAPNGQLDKNKIVAECAKFCAKQYGL